MEKPLKLSIITINLNNYVGLHQTITSVIQQTSDEFEYIIIDGGSTDGSIQLIKENETFINKWISAPDNGIYHAMNKGIKIAEGDYIQFLNSGDRLVNSEVTSLMLDNLEDCTIVFGNMLKIMSNGKIRLNKEINVNSFLTFYNGSLNLAPAYIKRTLFDRYGLFDENLKIVSDWKFFLIAIVFNNEKVSYRNIEVAYFDMNGISSKNKELDNLERRRVLEELVPANILADYDRYASYILQMKRINRYKLNFIVSLLERILFKLEKFESKIRGEHILY